MLQPGDEVVVRAMDEKAQTPDEKLPDVGGRSIAELVHSRESPLANAARRVAEQAGQSVYAAHGSSPTPL
jgi:hypothetical protein